MINENYFQQKLDTIMPLTDAFKRFLGPPNEHPEPEGYIMESAECYRKILTSAKEKLVKNMERTQRAKEHLGEYGFPPDECDQSVDAFDQVLERSEHVIAALDARLAFLDLSATHLGEEAIHSRAAKMYNLVEVAAETSALNKTMYTDVENDLDITKLNGVAK